MHLKMVCHWNTGKPIVIHTYLKTTRCIHEVILKISTMFGPDRQEDKVIPILADNFEFVQLENNSARSLEIVADLPSERTINRTSKDY